MLDTFIVAQREEIISRAKKRVAARTSPEQELPDGIPAFLEQLVVALRLADSTDKIDHDQIRESAGKQGNAALHIGLSIEEVVHEYGDICQTVTELAIELEVRIPTGEFRVMNLCLDDAIAQAVTEFARQSARSIEDARTDRLGELANELRTQLACATTSFAMIKGGQVAAGGTTGMVLQRSLTALNGLIERVLAGVPSNPS